ncbi:hypothetical protein HYH03_006600 [Edaphochlamys debaryana]|uniref:Uncharacterized protein n=1 Tax=Edaphochlamys debaryana TaxID=47281 RepID=A0A835Y3H2_9CHLO|nr:hypothetical protein HYH03_006600 [Edaphochlamys debaryana]|eukprot:KAG2495330.1 hypothetical protein HYH03_006600 [Edaphochlamys debaryana]
MGPSQSLTAEREEQDTDLDASCATTTATTSASAYTPYTRSVNIRSVANDVCVDSAIARSEQILATHAKAPANVQRGFINEVHHETSFNVNAIKQGASVRAQPVPGNAAADISIVDGTKTVAEVQTKSYKSGKALRVALNKPKYDGMQKVGNADVNARGVADRITAGGVSSDPLTLAEGNAATADPTVHFNKYRPNLVADSARAGVVGAGVGAAVGAAVAVGATLATKGRIDYEDAAVVGESAAVSAAAGGVGSLVGVATRSSPFGALAAGTVGVAYGVWKLRGRRAAMAEEAVKGTSSAVASLAAGAVTCVALGPLGWAAMPFVMGSSMLAGTRARVAAEAMVEVLVVRSLVARVFKRVLARARAEGAGHPHRLPPPPALMS